MPKICFAMLMLFFLASNDVPAWRLAGNLQAATLMTLEEERKMGKKRHADALKHKGVYDHPELTEYVDQIGKRLLAVVDPLPFDVSFTITNTGIHFGSSGPGGYIYIDRLMLGAADNEDEVAGILAHEISHVAKRHWAEHHALGIIDDSCDLTNVVGLDKAGVEHLLQQSEYEADAHAVQMTADAGYDPIAVRSLTDALVTSESESGRGDFSWHLPSSECGESHPPWAKRSARIRALAEELRGSSSLIRDPSYLKRIEGMLFGPNLKRFFKPDESDLADEISIEGQLVIYEVKPGDTFKSVVTMPGIDLEKTYPQFRGLNRIETGIELPVGTLLKLVR